MRLQPRIRRLNALAAAYVNDPRRRGLDLKFVDPCYWLIGRLNERSVVLDFGLGNDADFSQAVIARFGSTSHGFDPTRRHQPGLRTVVDANGGRFVLHEVAIGARRGTCTFYESQENISGSTLSTHYNVTHDTIVKYDVDMVTVKDAIEMAGGHADLIKVDIEGQEFDVVDGLQADVIRSVDQWIVEFHHDAPGFDFARTRRAIDKFCSVGFACYTRDNVNFLFYRR